MMKPCGFKAVGYVPTHLNYTISGGFVKRIFVNI